MSRSLTPRIAGASGCAVLPVAALAFAGLACAQGEAPPVSATLYAGIEAGNTDTRRFDVGGTFLFGAANVLNVAAARAELQYDDGDAASSYAALGFSHDFGAFGVGGGARRGEVRDISSTAGWYVAGFVDRGELRLGAEVELRQTDLDATPFAENVGGNLGFITGTSRCSVDSIGYQAQARLDRPGWSAFASLRFYDYGDEECALDIDGVVPNPPGNGNGNGRGNAFGRARRLTELALAPAASLAGRLFPREATLLESSMALGASAPLSERWLGGMELYHDVERVGGDSFATALAYAGLRLDDTWTTEFSLGYTLADDVDDTLFAGVRVSATL